MGENRIIVMGKNPIPIFHNKLQITYRGIKLEALPELCQSPVPLNSTAISLLANKALVQFTV